MSQRLNSPVTHRRRFHARDYASIVERQQGLCACCGEPLGTDPRDIEFDHWTEVAIGGTDTLDNLRALRKKHHLDRTRSRAAVLAKTGRIEAKGGHRRRNLNRTERELQRMLEKGRWSVDRESADG